ncbi:MAG: hypothetical protein HOQ22_13345 [Nocardioidaceae bacterium]|nr:hypothetical protein [Nocardioidaceae bacterium]
MVALVALPAAVAYGGPLARSRTPTADITYGISHYPMQASLALAVAGLAVAGALLLVTGTELVRRRGR